MSFPVICLNCAETASVNKITAGLRHSCGGAVDLYFGTPEQTQAVARRHASTFDEWMGYTASGDHSGEEDDESNEYAGPMPGPNPMSNHEGTITCPACMGSGRDIQDKTNPCRECGGDGTVTPTTTAEDVQVAKHSYPPSGPTGQRDRQTTVPFMGRRKQQAPSRRTAMLRSIAATNPGLTRRQQEWLVDRAMQRFPEVR